MIIVRLYSLPPVHGARAVYSDRTAPTDNSETASPGLVAWEQSQNADIDGGRAADVVAGVAHQRPVPAGDHALDPGRRPDHARRGHKPSANRRRRRGPAHGDKDSCARHACSPPQRRSDPSPAHPTATHLPSPLIIRPWESLPSQLT